MNLQQLINQYFWPSRAHITTTRQGDTASTTLTIYCLNSVYACNVATGIATDMPEECALGIQALEQYLAGTPEFEQIV